MVNRMATLERTQKRLHEGEQCGGHVSLSSAEGKVVQTASCATDFLKMNTMA
jgi:hypothetical protein